MNDRDALYRAILAHPEEDTPRLVYADWLEENDREEEAEFIRLGCRLEVESPDHPDYVAWTLRHEELKLWLATHSPGPQPKFSGGLTVSGGPTWCGQSWRGFPRFLECDADEFTSLKDVRTLAASVDKAFATLPTRWLVVRWLTIEQLAELLRQPVLSQLERITVQLRFNDGGDDEAARLLAQCPQLANLRGACFAFRFGVEGATALARSSTLNRLEWFTFDADSLDPAVITALGSAHWFQNLRALELDDGLPPAAFEELCRLPPFPRLHSLGLADNAFFDAPWRVFARSKSFPALRRIQLDRNPLGNVWATAKWLQPTWLEQGSSGPVGVEALKDHPWLSSVRWLSLWSNSLGPNHVKTIAGSRKLTNLRHLNLKNNAIGVSGLHAIAKNPALRNLLSLDIGTGYLREPQLKPDHFQEFLAKLDMPNLRHLSLEGRPVGGRAVRLLMDNKFQSLTRLNLSKCQLTDAAVTALLTAPALQNLIELNLDSNRLTEGVTPLTKLTTLPQLSKCTLKGNKIPERMQKRLAQRPGVEV